MDPKILKHYHGPQAEPLILSNNRAALLKSVEGAPAKQRPVWPVVVYGALLGFITVMCIVTLLHHL